MITELIEKYNNGRSIENLAKDYQVGKLKIKKILIENNIQLNKKGGQIKYKPPIQDQVDYDGFILSCKNCQKTFNDVSNKSGSITDHINNCFPNEKIPTTYKRRMVFKSSGIHWHHQFFNLIPKPIVYKLNCLECNWSTSDINNKSGSFTKHIESKHGLVSEYLSRNEEHTYLFSGIKNEQFRKEYFKDDDNFITCEVCGEQMKSITNTHLSIHNLTVHDYKTTYNGILVSNTTKNEFIKNLQSVDCGYHYRSKSEIEIEEFLKSLGVDVIVCDKKQLNGIEIDLFLPEHKIGIEYNGLYWHSEKRGKTKKYHLDKTNKCLEKGIKLIHIFSDEWVSKKDVIKNRLMNSLGLFDKKIYARKCEVVEITKGEKSYFLKQNHLQGDDKSKIFFGLKTNGELVGVMTFGQLRKILGSKAEEGTYELYRYCSNNVVGGFSKLLKFFIEKYKPKKIITYANRNWSPSDEFSFYSKVGFNFIGFTEPNYSYTKKYDYREYRFNYRKDKLVKLGYDKNKTESQIMFELGYDKIWDTGNLKYEMVLI